jgi:hypothetical protein
MFSNGFDRPRRDFLSTSVKIVATGALSTILPLELPFAQAGVNRDNAWSLPSDEDRGLRATSRWVAGPAELGAQVFRNIPKPVRAYALQIRCMLAGLKPACRMSLTVEELQESISYLRSLDCALVIEQAPRVQALFSQMSPQHRREAARSTRLRIYLAKSMADAKKLAVLEKSGADYQALGLSLGYPACCVEAAAQHDYIIIDESSQERRQGNLNSMAVRRSVKADFRCNQLLVESDLNGAGPMSAIAHYPCKLDCDESVAIGQSALECCARAWPVWAITMSELLRAPVLYWADDDWPSESWDEYCGLALIGARKKHADGWDSDMPAIHLGAGGTPDGGFPYHVMAGQFVKGQILLQDSKGKVTSQRFEVCGQPWVIDWRANMLQRLS